jgi:hypothetical protein
MTTTMWPWWADSADRYNNGDTAQWATTTTRPWWADDGDGDAAAEG